jgi:hypothetical protein
MSEYWGACYGTALVLREEEFFTFFHRYAEICHPLLDNTHKEQLQDILAGKRSLDGFKFLKSASLPKMLKESGGTDPNQPGLSFSIEEIPLDYADGMAFLALDSDEEDDSLRFETCYVAWSSKGTGLSDVLKGESYSCEQELVDEYKEKFASFLPEDFAWRSHIGEFSCAMYA